MAPQAAAIANTRARKPAREISHNLNGQRLGRKGRDTRERILAVAREIVAEESDAVITLSEVARRAELRMASLYVYFADLSELVEALLEPVMAEAEDAYLGLIRTRWADVALAEKCSAFINGFYGFWYRHAQILHLRNTLADKKEQRMIRHRVESARPVIGMITQQMDHDPDQRGTPAVGMATVLYMGFERAINIATDTHFGEGMGEAFNPDVAHYLVAEAQLLEFGIRKNRAVV
jgi:AcrR family transcriptional regulator